MVVEGREVKVEHVAGVPAEDGGSDRKGAFVFVGNARERSTTALMGRDRRWEGGRGRRGGKEEGRGRIGDWPATQRATIGLENNKALPFVFSCPTNML